MLARSLVPAWLPGVCWLAVCCSPPPRVVATPARGKTVAQLLARGELRAARALAERRIGATAAAEPPRRFERSVTALESSPSAIRLAIADGGGLSVLDARFDEILRLSLPCRYLAWPLEEELLCAAADGRVLAIDLASADTTELARLPGAATSLAAQANRWVATGGGRALARERDGRVSPLPVLQATASAISNDAARIAIGHEDGAVSVLDAATRRTRLEVAAPDERAAVAWLRFSADDAWLAASFEDGPARVVSSANGQLRGFVPLTRQFRFSPDGRRLVTGGASYVVGEPFDAGSIASGAPSAPATAPAASIWIGEGGALRRTGFEGEADVTLRPAPERVEHGWSVPIEALAQAAAQAGKIAAAAVQAASSAASCGDSPGISSQDGAYTLCAHASRELELRDATGSIWRVKSPILPAGFLDVSTARGVVLVGSAEGEAALLESKRGDLIGRVWISSLVKSGSDYSMRGYVTDTRGHIELMGVEAGPAARCAVGPWRLPLAACPDLLEPGLLARLLRAQK